MFEVKTNLKDTQIITIDPIIVLSCPYYQVYSEKNIFIAPSEIIV